MPRWSNCWAWGLVEFARLHAAWRRAGMPKGLEPFLMLRPSRSRPRLIPHLLVGVNSPDLDLPVRSYTPLHRRDVPWWLAWTRLAFRGQVTSGDKHKA